MKNIYIRPTMLLIRISNESLLTGGSENGQIDYGFSKKHDFTDDSFDTAWPKDKSPWETDD